MGTGAPNGQPYKYGAYIPFANASASTWPAGHGAVSFYLPDIRCNYDFLLLRRVPGANGTTSANQVLARAPSEVWFDPAQALGVHVAFTENPDEMRINWNSGSNAKPIVMWRPKQQRRQQKQRPSKDAGAGDSAAGADGDAPWSSVGGTTTTYGADDLCGSEAAEVQPQNFIDPGYFHSAVITGLQPGTVYEYRVVQDIGPPSDIFTVRAAPRSTDPVAFLMWADMGADQYDQLVDWGDVDMAGQLIQQVLKHEAIVGNGVGDDEEEAAIPVGLVTHVGDLSYACGSGFVWEQWMQLIQPVAAHVPYMVAVGNHEYDHLENSTTPGGGGVDISGVLGPSFHPAWGDYRDDSYGECGVTTAKRFTMPAGSSGSNGVFWYSFDYGPVHFTIFSAEHNFTQGSEQFAWLQQDLAAAHSSRERTPWLVVQMHRPMYASEAPDGAHDQHLVVAERLRENLEPMFSTAGVDLVMTGHLHSYERSCSVLNETCVGQGQGGIVHLRVGTAGGQSDNCKAIDPACPNNDTMYFYNDTAWREVGLYQYGYARVTVPNASALHVEFVQNDNNVADEVWLRK